MFARIGLAALGVAAIVWLVAEAGADEVAGLLRRAAPWLPLVFVLEGLRIVAEALATRRLLGPRGHQVTGKELARVHLVGYAVCMAMPAGRAAAEAVKSTMLSPAVGAARAFAIGVAGQALHLVAGGLASLVCTVVALAATGWSALTIALVVNTTITGGGGVAVGLVARNGRFAERLTRFPRLATALGSFRDAARELPLLPLAPLAWIFLTRIVQTAELGVLAFAVGLGAGLESAFLTQGVMILGSTVGDLVPGQLGVTEGAFRMGADAISSGVAQAVTVPVLLHVIVIGWIVIGALVPVFMRPNGRREEGGAHGGASVSA